MKDGATRGSCIAQKRRICIPPLQMLKLDMLEVEAGSTQATKNTWKVMEHKMLSQTLYMHCSEEVFSLRSLSAATKSDTSDPSREKTHANLKDRLPLGACNT